MSARLMVIAYFAYLCLRVGLFFVGLGILTGLLLKLFQIR